MRPINDHFNNVHDDIELCTWPDCTAKRNGSHQLCGVHLARRSGHTHGKGGHGNGNKPLFTREEELAIVKRVRNFESPKKIAKELGIVVGTVHDIMRRNRS